jgi:hypothetical protein
MSAPVLLMRLTSNGAEAVQGRGCRTRVQTGFPICAQDESAGSIVILGSYAPNNDMSDGL